MGSEAHARGLCRTALIEKVLPPEDRADGITRHDLEETALATVLDDACSYSLFATRRLIWVAGAEGALPRRLGTEEDEGATALLLHYVKNPTPGTVLMFEASRFEFDGEDKPKLERVQKFYAPIRDQVEFRPYTPEAVRMLAEDLTRRHHLQIGRTELGFLVESLGGDAARLSLEIEKLALFAGERKITAADIAELVPSARATTIFALVQALGRADRKRSLDALDLLLKEGEYLPLALTFLATQFRLALAAQEAGAKNASQIQALLTKQGVRIWRDRAEQVAQTVSAFSKERLEMAMERVFRADKALRDTRPDDRVVMEEFVLSLTS